MLGKDILIAAPAANLRDNRRGTVAINSARQAANSEANEPPMPVPTTSGDFLTLVRKSGVVDRDLLDPFERRLSATAPILPIRGNSQPR